jgi:hypothetical protein
MLDWWLIWIRSLGKRDDFLSTKSTLHGSEFKLNCIILLLHCHLSIFYSLHYPRWIWLTYCGDRKIIFINKSISKRARERDESWIFVFVVNLFSKRFIALVLIYIKSLSSFGVICPIEPETIHIHQLICCLIYLLTIGLLKSKRRIPNNCRRFIYTNRTIYNHTC